MHFDPRGPFNFAFIDIAPDYIFSGDYFAFLRQVPALVRPRLHFLAMISLLFRFLMFYFYSVIDGNGKAHGLSDREPIAA